MWLKKYASHGVNNHASSNKSLQLWIDFALQIFYMESPGKKKGGFQAKTQLSLWECMSDVIQCSVKK